MASFKTPLDYFNAMRTVSGGKLYRYPYAAYSVLLCKFRHGLGPRFHSLFRLAEVPQERWNGYLQDETLRLVLRSINPPSAREIVNDKLAFHDHCVAQSLPTIPIFCAIEQPDSKYPKSPVTVETEEDWCRRMGDLPDRLFVKLIDGSWGVDAFVAERKGDQWSFGKRHGTAAQFYAFLRERIGSKRGWIVQPLVEAHQKLKSISSGSALPTIRANTCFIEGVPRLLFAVLRIPVGDNVTDNFSHGASGNVIAPIDLKTGILGPCRGSASREWPQIVGVSVHPDTGNSIEGFQIPMWDQILEVLEQGQKSLPDLKTLGWDIAVTDSGPLIVETNATYDIDIVQVAYQRGVRSEMEELFGAIG